MIDLWREMDEQMFPTERKTPQLIPSKKNTICFSRKLLPKTENVPRQNKSKHVVIHNENKIKQKMTNQ